MRRLLFALLLLVPALAHAQGVSVSTARGRDRRHVVRDERGNWEMIPGAGRQRR